MNEEPRSAVAVLLEQISMNLIGNAIDATPWGGRITVTTGAEPDGRDGLTVFAEIHDTGHGVPRGDAAKIFDLFYTTKAQGTGVGLAVAKEFTEAHGGGITVSAGADKGAVFRVTLPARVEVAPCRP